MRLIKDFVWFLFYSKSIYKVHSPYVYSLIKHIKKQKNFAEFHEIYPLILSLKSDNTYLEIKDYGAGSKYSSSKKVKVKSILKRASKRKSQLKLISRFASYHKAEEFIELGTSLGITSSVVKVSNPNIKVSTIEADESIYKKAKENFTQLKIDVNAINNTFDNVIEEIAINCSNKNCIYFIDGNHTEEATLRYFEIIKKHSNSNTAIIFDDIRWSGGMKSAWKQIINDSKVSYSLDFFMIGIVLFNKDLVKQKFLLRHFL